MSLIEARFPNQISDHEWLRKDRTKDTETLFNHANDHNKSAAEIVAIERSLGTNPEADYPDVATRLDDYEQRISELENQQTSQYVKLAGDTMTGALTLPRLIMGNYEGNARGISVSKEGYISPLEKFQTDAFKVNNFRGEALFSVPYDGSDARLRGSRILTTANHTHRTDAANDARFWRRTDRIGYQITLEGYDELYQEIVVGAEGTVRVVLDTSAVNHFKIRSNGASVDVELTGVPPSTRRRGVTVALQNYSTNTVTLRVLNSHIWPDYDPPPSTSTQPERDTELFLYTAGEGNHWLVHPYYLNERTRPGTAAYPVQTKYRFRLFGRAGTAPTSIADDLGTGLNLNFWNGSLFSAYGFEVAASSNRYGVTDVLPSLTLDRDMAIAVLVRNANAAEQHAAFAAAASKNSDFNYLRLDADLNNELLSRVINQTGSYDNSTKDVPALPLRTGSDVWTLMLVFKKAEGYGIRNINRFAAGLTDYEAFREFPIDAATSTYLTPTFEANPGSLRLGIGVVPRESYATTPIGLGTFICGMLLAFDSDLAGAEMLQLYRAIRQDMTALGIGTLPEPSI